jgi:hypothetical protein
MAVKTKQRTRKAHLRIQLNGADYLMEMNKDGATLRSSPKIRNDPGTYIAWSTILNSVVNIPVQTTK